MMCPLMTTLGQQKCLSLSLERNRRHWKGLTLVPLLHTHMSWRPKHRAGSRVHQLSLHTVFPQRQLFRRHTQLPSSHWIFSLRDLQRRSLNG
ncbi:translocon-associated protein beta (TRAPB) family protein [Zea mays]|uniref:Translocon-associated protein beta (TRAPB) family protein n=1 Tax=Zea mays TaxID=4577 RepID=A0A1D6MWX5_MAIZE|nr:translocon-associated protein beta (TRAPB) family protein [Zea mays]